MKKFLIPLMLIVSACGFHPMYGDNSVVAQTTGTPSVQMALNTVEVGNIQDRWGLYLRNALIDRFYKTSAPASPLYHLDVSKLNESIADLDITVDNDATRRQLRMSTTMTLTRLDTSEVVLTRPVYALVSYNVLQSKYTTNVAEDNARENATDDLARQIEQVIVLYFGHSRTNFAP